MNLPPTEPNQGEPLRADWGRAIQRHARSCQIVGVTGGTFQRTATGTIINIDRPRAGGGGSSSTPSAPHPFKVINTPKSPVPESGELEDIYVYGGRANGILAQIGSSTPPAFGYAQLATTGMLATGAYWYVYAEVRNGAPRPIIKCAQYTPLDAGGVRYITIAGVRAVITGNKWTWEVFQYVNEDIECDSPLPFECEIVRENGSRYLDMKGGKITMAVQNWGHAELFSDTSHRAGAKEFTHPSFQSLVIPTGGGSLWVAYEYPKKGTAISAANWGKLQITATSQMPKNRPWVIIAEKNANADTAQSDLGNGTDIPTTAESQGALDAQTAEQGTAPTKANADAQAALQAPPEGTWDEFTTANVTKPSTNGRYTGAFGWADWSRDNRETTYTWKKLGVIVKQVSIQWAQTLSVTSSGTNSPSSGNNQNPYEDGRVGIGGAYSGLSTNDVFDYGYVYQSWNYEMAGVLSITTGLPTGNSDLISNGLQVGYMRFRYNTYDNARGWATDVSGYRTGTRGRTVSTDLFYGDGRTGTSVGGSTDPYNPSDGSVADAVGDNPGKPPRGDGITAPPAANEANQGATNNGTPVTAAGPGLWVFEIARISGTGELTQCHTGDIVFHPAPQVCVRTNPKVAALP